MNYLIFVIVLVFFSASSCNCYVFDVSSCDNMLPVLVEAQMMSSSSEATTSTTTKQELAIDGFKRIREPQTQSPQMKGHVQILSQSLDPSPYKVTIDAEKYRRKRTHTVKIEGSTEFDGFMLQARQYLRPASSPALMGTFVDLPNKVHTLDCDRGPSFSVSNTAVSDGDDATAKNSVELKWKAPADDVGSIQFVATVIHGSTYWHFVNSTPLILNDFPPSLDGCGKDRSCFRYSQVEDNCNDGQCNYLMVSKVIGDYVLITIGGRIEGDSGYVAIGFTPDKDKLSLVDICACMKKKPNEVDSAHYMITPEQNGRLEKHNDELEDEETDIDGDQIWCRFRRPLKIPGTESVDLTGNLFQLFLWGNLDSSNNAPVMPKNEDIVRAVETWNHTQTLNFVHLVGGSDIARISWTILFAVLLATLVELY